MTEKKKTTKKKAPRKKKDVSEEATVPREQALAAEAEAETEATELSAEERSESTQPMSAGDAKGAALGWFKAILALPNDNPKKTIAVAVALCLVCSILVSGAAVVLKPLQESNKAADRKKNILEVASLMEPGKSVNEAFEVIETRIVDLQTGEFTDAVNPAKYDQRKASKDPAQNVQIPRGEDIASIKTRARYAEVYLVRDGDDISQIILPVHGYGLWSTLYGFLSLEGNLNTVSGLRFYAHAETPGLGGEVDNPAWREKWRGKMVYGEDGQVRLQVVKGNVDASTPDAEYKVDGLAGATLTSNGVTNLIQYWLGEQAFGPFLQKMRTGSS